MLNSGASFPSRRTYPFIPVANLCVGPVEGGRTQAEVGVRGTVEPARLGPEHGRRQAHRGGAGHPSTHL